MFFRDVGDITSLTFSDLRFEWILSACMVLALGAVFSPLFILLGLREGLVGNMLDDLKSDPISRLVMPKFPLNRSLDDAWLKALADRSHTVISSPTSRLLLDVEGVEEPVNVVPTIAEDPLLIENEIALPKDGLWLAISSRLAHISDKQAGDTFTVTLVRKVRREERVPVEFRVAGVLPGGASDDAKIWMPLGLFRRLDEWREGQALPELGLPGSGSGLAPEYDGVITLLEEVPSDADYRRMLSGRLGFSQLPKPLDIKGWKKPLGRYALLWKTINSRVFEPDLLPLVNRHHEQGYAVEAIPYVESFQVALRARKFKRMLELTILPSDRVHGDISGPEHDSKFFAQISPDYGIGFGEFGEISFKSIRGRNINIPITLAPYSDVRQGFIAVPRELAGKMNAARRQQANFDTSTGELTSVDEDMRFFRAYAKSIDDLEDLVRFVQKEGLRIGSQALREPISRVGEVRSIRQLANYMEKLYILIALVCGVSGFFAISANVYAGVQRKRRDLAYLQLLGIHRSLLFLFTLFKSLILVVGGIASALIAYAAFAHFSTWVLEDILTDTNSLTRLTGKNIVVLVTAIIGAASFASLLAAAAVASIEPGEHIRE